MILSETALRIATVSRDDKTQWVSLTVLYRKDTDQPWEQRTLRLSPEEYSMLRNAGGITIVGNQFSAA